jgi:hypothetical protein
MYLALTIIADLGQVKFGLEFWVIYTNFVNLALGRKMINIESGSFRPDCLFAPESESMRPT